MVHVRIRPVNFLKDRLAVRVMETGYQQGPFLAVKGVT